MASAKERFEELRRRRPFVDHVVRMVQHYGQVKGSALAGAVTYFGFLSFFPILVLAFAAVGFVSQVYDIEKAVESAITSVLPGVVGDEPGEISIETFQDAAGAAVGIGVIGVLYTGLGWISGLRDALLLTFEKPVTERPSFVVGKLKDLVSLVLIGVVMVLSVGVAGLVGSLSEEIVELLEIDAGLDWVLQVVSVVVGLAANTVLFYALFRLLADPDSPARSLWSGALFGAIGFEALKKVAFLLIESIRDRPAFAVFGVALVLLVWINYFSRVVMYSASWAHTSAEARALRDQQALEARQREQETRALADVQLREVPSRAGRFGLTPARAFAAGGASMLGAVAVLRRRRGEDA